MSNNIKVSGSSIFTYQNPHLAPITSWDGYLYCHYGRTKKIVAHCPIKNSETVKRYTRFFFSCPSLFSGTAGTKRKAPPPPELWQIWFCSQPPRHPVHNGILIQQSAPLSMSQPCSCTGHNTSPRHGCTPDALAGAESLDKQPACPDPAYNPPRKYGNAAPWRTRRLFQPRCLRYLYRCRQVHSLRCQF